jgi:NAD(P)H-flavin reductase
MATGTGTILELRLEAEGLSGWITCPPGLRPAPGQYLVASGPDPYSPLPVVLFSSGSNIAYAPQPPAGQVALWIAPPLPPTWSAGMQIVLRGPLGNGFHMPSTARRVALACPAGPAGPPYRLLPLAEQALSQRAAVAIYANRAPAGLPEEVEVLPLDLLAEAPAWADFLALDVCLPDLSGLRARLGLNPYQRVACQTQVLVVTAMPCSGLAECGVCALPTREGWKLACADGPVFDFNKLEGS